MQLLFSILWQITCSRNACCQQLREKREGEVGRPAYYGTKTNSVYLATLPTLSIILKVSHCPRSENMLCTQPDDPHFRAEPTSHFQLATVLRGPKS